MYIGNKKLKEIQRISEVKEILKEYIGKGFLKNFKLETFNDAPNTWNEDETALFDMLYDLEDKLKSSIIAKLRD